jgi:hypothetical protein
MATAVVAARGLAIEATAVVAVVADVGSADVTGACSAVLALVPGIPTASAAVTTAQLRPSVLDR